MSYYVSEYIDEDNCVSYSSIRQSYYDKINVKYNCQMKKERTVQNKKKEASYFVYIDTEESSACSQPISISSSNSSDSYEFRTSFHIDFSQDSL